MRYMNTSELSRYLGINEKKIYALIIEKGLPATKVTGKWLFVDKLIDIWIENSMENHPLTLNWPKGILMIAGSNDPLLDLTVNEAAKAETRFFSFFCNTGSLGGLSMLKNGKAHISVAHLLDSKEEEYNLPFIDSCLPGFSMMVINFAYRQQGLIIKADNPLKIKGPEDLHRQEIKFINRQPGSGTRMLLDGYLKKSGIATSGIRGYRTEVSTHFEVGFNILRGIADVGPGIKAVADMLGLGFIPLREECFDLLIPKHYFFFQEIQLLLQILNSPQFKRGASRFGGYDTRDSGKITYNC